MAHIVISGPSCVRVPPPLHEHQQRMMHTGAPLPRLASSPLASPRLPSPHRFLHTSFETDWVSSAEPTTPGPHGDPPSGTLDMQSDAACSESAMFGMSGVWLAAGWCTGGTEVARERFSRACAFERSNPFRVKCWSTGVPELSGRSLVPVALRHGDQLSRCTRVGLDPGPGPPRLTECHHDGAY